MNKLLFAIVIALSAICTQIFVFARAFEAMVAGSSSGVGLWLVSIAMALITFVAVWWGRRA